MRSTLGAVNFRHVQAPFQVQSILNMMSSSAGISNQALVLLLMVKVALPTKLVLPHKAQALLLMVKVVVPTVMIFVSFILSYCSLLAYYFLLDMAYEIFDSF